MRELINILGKIRHEKGSSITVSIVGAGGKTTLMYFLGKELEAAGYRTLMTTTTMLYYPEEEDASTVLLGKDSLMEFLITEKSKSSMTPGTEGNASKSILFGSHIIETDEKKIKGFEKVEMESLEKSGLFEKFDFVLIEADGSKRKSVKASNDSEPVIIEITDAVIGVVGLDCLEKEINEENVHRAEAFAKLMNKKLGDRITDIDIKDLAISKEGLFKNTPSHSKKILILNKAETERIEAGKTIINLIRKEYEMNANRAIAEKSYSDKSAEIEHFMLASLEQGLIYNSYPLKLTKIVFGAGVGKRMNAQKLLLDLNGKSIIEHVLLTVGKIKSSRNGFGVNDLTTETILVYSDDRIKETAERYEIDSIIRNPEPERGMSNSLKLTVSNSSKDTDAYMFFMGDQPFITEDSINKLIKFWMKDTTRIVVPYFAGKRGNPVIFPSLFYDKLMAVTGDKGGRDVIISNLDKVSFLEIENEMEGLDIDDPETYETLKSRLC